MNLQVITHKIREYEKKYHRELNSVRLIAVSKKQPVEKILEAIELGQNEFAESYIQEAIPKIEFCRNNLNSSSYRGLHPPGTFRGIQEDNAGSRIFRLAAKFRDDEVFRFSVGEKTPIIWHFIGPIQSNKTKLIAENFDWVHSIDRIKIANRLNDQRTNDLPPLNVCIEVNIDQEKTKSGILMEEVEILAKEMIQLPQLKLRGLMAIPEHCDNFETQREKFKLLKNCFNELNQKGFQLDTLSMGMTDDFESAIAEGATMVRIGTGVFGSR